MSSPENFKLNIQPTLTVEQLNTVTKLRGEILAKIAKLDEALRSREEQLNSNLRKDEKVVLEESFNRLEAHKKDLLGQMPEMPATPQQTTPVKESLILDQYGNPFNQAPKPPVKILDQYGNPFPPSEQLTPVTQPIQQPAQQPVQAPPTPTPEPPAQPKAPTPIQQPAQQPVQNIPITVTQAPASSPINNAPVKNITAVPVTPVAPTGPTGPATPNTPVTPVKTPEQLLAEKIRRGDPLTREDLTLRRTRWTGTDGVEKALEKLATPPDPNEVHNFIEHTGPNLERSRNDYVLALFQNRNSYYPDVATIAHIKNLKEAYNKNVDTEINAIQPIGDRVEDKIACKKLRLKFLIAEREAFQREILRLDSEETRKRVKQAIDRALDKTGKFFDKAKEKWNKGMDRVGKFFEDDPNTKGMGWIYYLVASQGAPLMAAAWGEKPIGEAVDNGINTLRKKFKEALSSKTPKKESPETKKTLSEKFGDKDKKEKTPEEVEAERKKVEIEGRKKEFLEKVTGVELKGRDLDTWIKSSKVYVGKFFNPSRFKTAKTIDDYPPFQRKIHDALLPEYEKAKLDKTKDIKATNKLNLEEFITKLAEQDKLKDLWKTT